MDQRQSVYIAASLDGFIARKNGDLDWLMENEPDAAGEDYGYQEFMDTVDALVMGRNTYEKVLSFGDWPYGSTKVFVLSSRSLDLPERLPDTVSALSGSPHEIIRELADRGLNHLYIDGGKTIQGFLNAGLIQEITITRIPVLIGDGVPLFWPLEKDLKLEHLSTQSFDNGFVQSRYRVKHDNGINVK